MKVDQNSNRISWVLTLIAGLVWWNGLPAVEASRARIRISVPNSASLDPGISSFRPAMGPVGTIVTVDGVHFSRVTHVTVDRTPCDTFTVLSDFRIALTIPAGARSGPIEVRVGNGQPSLSGRLTVISTPRIFGFSPDSAAADEPVIIRGERFLGVDEVLFNGTASARFWVHSDTEIEAYLPAGALTGPLVLSNAAGSGAAADSLHVIPPPNTLTFDVTHDAYVASASVAKTFGGRPLLQIKGTANEDQVAFLKFSVLGLWTVPDVVKLQLYVENSGDQGGSIYQVSNEYRISATGWIENNLSWYNAPPITGAPLDFVGEIIDGQLVEFDVTSAVTGDGIYSFAITSTTSDVVKYGSKEGAVPPKLVVMMSSAESDSTRALAHETSGANQDQIQDGLEVMTLSPNYPNPFNAETRIEYRLPAASRVNLGIFNLLGQRVRVLVDKSQTPGNYEVLWDGRNDRGRGVSSGIFFVQLRTAEKSIVRRILVQK